MTTHSKVYEGGGGAAVARQVVGMRCRDEVANPSSIEDQDTGGIGAIPTSGDMTDDAKERIGSREAETDTRRKDTILESDHADIAMTR